MTSFWIMLSGFFVANMLWFIAILNSSFLEYVNPKFIANSYDLDKNEELESILLKSFQKYIQRFFNTPGTAGSARYVENLGVNLSEDDLNLNKNMTIEREEVNSALSSTDEILRNYQPIIITNSSKLSMFLDSEKKIVYIVKVSNERDSPHRFDSKAGEISLYYIPVHNFILDPNESGRLDYSMIKKCWSSRFYGRIIGAVSSNDKQHLGIFYRLVKGPHINYRIRFFHNISCDNFDIEKTDETLNNKFEEFLGKNKGDHRGRKLPQDNNGEFENYFEISNSGGNINSNEKNNLPPHHHHFENYFNDDSYDDFSLKGNTPISSMTIKKDVIAYSRDFDYRQFYILKREKSQISSASWKVSLLGPPINKTIHNLFHTNSLKFANDTIHDYKLLHIYVTMNVSGINTYGYVIKANHTDYTKPPTERENLTETNITSTEEVINNSDEMPLDYSIRRVAKYSIETEILNLNNYEDFNADNSIQKLKRFMKPTVFSSSNHPNNLLFEFKSGTVCIMGWSKKTNSEYFFNLTPDGEEKVSKIAADENNENIIIKFEKTKEMLYFFRYKEKKDKESVYYDITKNINLKSIPKKYRDKEVLTFLIEKVNDKVILFMLNENGILISLDFTKITKKWQGRNWLFITIFSDFNYTASLIMFANLLTLVIYLRFFRRGTNTGVENEAVRGRNAEINQVIQDIIRLNNLQMALGGNLQNIATSVNRAQQEAEEVAIPEVIQEGGGEVIVNQIENNNNQVIVENVPQQEHENIEQPNNIQLPNTEDSSDNINIENIPNSNSETT